MQKFGFVHQHVGWFLDPDAVAWRQIFPKYPATRIVNDDHLPLAPQVARGGHFVPEGAGGRAGGRVSWQYATSQHVSSRVGPHYALAAFDAFARVKAPRCPGGRGGVLDALRVDCGGRGSGLAVARIGFVIAPGHAPGLIPAKQACIRRPSIGLAR